ncbi:MAG: hypothetical protein KF763_21030 [Cyclobacteriaceae bacterium]|nr:hypothetical protein [Cyclobacteriaceae bacterium]
MPRTQEDTLVQKKIADVAASLVELIGVQISYTAVSGRVYGATFKDITVGANNYGYRTLDQLGQTKILV